MAASLVRGRGEILSGGPRAKGGPMHAVESHAALLTFWYHETDTQVHCLHVKTLFLCVDSRTVAV